MFSLIFLSLMNKMIYSNQNIDVPLIMKGNWSDTYLSDEAFLFFEYVYPDGIPIFTDIYNKRHGDFPSIQSIIYSLQSRIPRNILGLLNLSLYMRYFHPEAATIRTQPIQILFYEDGQSMYMNHFLLLIIMIFSGNMQHISIVMNHLMINFHFLKIQHNVLGFFQNK